jgi:sialic acid synthase SpsE/sugar phosphate isomerase/epimerase
MQIDRNISQYIVFSEDSLINALKKISDNQHRIVFSVTEAGVLDGILTDGDFRRWLIQQKKIDLNQPISIASNKHFKFAFMEDDPAVIHSHFSQGVEFIPLLDRNSHLVAIAKQEPDGIRIGEYSIDKNSPTFIIAEIGINHNGSFDLAKRLIDQAVASGADCAKFQMRDMASLYRNAGDANDAKEDLGAQYTLDLLSRFQLTSEEMLEVFDYCWQRGILPLCTPWDISTVNLLENYGMPAYKIASADLTNHDLLKILARTGKPLICSTGMSTESEIKESIALLQEMGAMYILLHCNSTYPAPFKDINLNYLDKLADIGSCPVGYSGHERGYHVAIASVAKGAKVIEKHFTLDKTMEGNDHKVSLLPEEFKAMVEGIRQVEQALGTRGERRPSQGELMNRENLAKSLMINCDLVVGQKITADMIEVKSPGQGLQPNKKPELIGRKAKRGFKKGDFFFTSDLEEEEIKPRPYKFNRPWGLPVRYHDFQSILSKSNPDFLEFHLSYKDMDQDVSQYFDGIYDMDLVVHSPDLFSGDHLLNLADLDIDSRKRSVRELQRVVDIARSLKPFFRKTSKTLVVASLGGFTKESHLLPSERSYLYELVADSLSQLDTSGVEILPQTLPPFPWYFGGQLFCNLFVDHKDIVEFCQKYDYRVCFDISHSKLACNYFHWSFQEFTDKVAPHTGHLHIVDATGVDGEGLQIGDGDIDFYTFANSINSLIPKVSFIPEIWQGHKNNGEGFWVALEKLEKLLK